MVEVVELPPRTRAMLRARQEEVAAARAMLNMHMRALQELVNVAGEALGVPDGWVLQDSGFVPPAPVTATGEAEVDV